MSKIPLILTYHPLNTLVQRIPLNNLDDPVTSLIFPERPMVGGRKCVSSFDPGHASRGLNADFHLIWNSRARKTQLSISNWLPNRGTIHKEHSTDEGHSPETSGHLVLRFKHFYFIHHFYLCYAMLCSAKLCNAMLCCAMLCYSYASLCYTMSCYGIPY